MTSQFINAKYMVCTISIRVFNGKLDKWLSISQLGGLCVFVCMLRGAKHNGITKTKLSIASFNMETKIEGCHKQKHISFHNS